MSKRNYTLIAAGLLAVSVVAMWWLAGELRQARSYGGPFVPRNCYLTQYRTGGDFGEIEPTSATSSQVLVKDNATEAATTTLVCDIRNVNGFDMELLTLATNTPSTLNFTYEFSNGENCGATTTESSCDWFATTRQSVASTSDDIPFKVGDLGNVFVSASSTVNQYFIRTRATTTVLVQGPRDMFSRWVRVGFKVSDGPTMRLWARLIMREPVR